jgi:hypothetical protein
MAAAKMAISSRDSTSILYSARRVAKKVSHSFTFGNVSNETLDILVGLCAGRGALLHIQRKQASNLFKRLSAAQTQPPILDDETWAAEVGGSITGEIKGKPILTQICHILPLECRCCFGRVMTAVLRSREPSQPSASADFPPYHIANLLDRPPQLPQAMGRAKFWSYISLSPRSR